MNINLFTGKEIFINKQPDNPLNEQVREKFEELYDDLNNLFMYNVLGEDQADTEEEFKENAVKYEYLVKGLSKLVDSYNSVENVFSV